MKKLLLVLAVLPLCLLAHSQEADELGNYAEFTIVPRLDFTAAQLSEDGMAYDLGNTSLYTLFEGSFSENFSFTVANHWFSASADEDFGLAWPYKALGRSDYTNFIDYLLLDYSLGDFTFSLGKDMILMGGFEYDDWDWDVHPVLATNLWNTVACYQWGAKLAYTLPSETDTFTIQMTTSPFGEHPFSSELYAYSLQWRGEHGLYSTIWSTSYLQAPESESLWFTSLGNRFDFSDNFYWVLDFNWIVDPSDYLGFYEAVGKTNCHNFGLNQTLSYAFGEKLSLSAKLNLSCFYKDSQTYWDSGSDIFGGLVLDWYPLEEQDLRVHLIVGANRYDTDHPAFIGVGARYNIPITLW